MPCRQTKTAIITINLALSEVLYAITRSIRRRRQFEGFNQRKKKKPTHEYYYHKLNKHTLNLSICLSV